MGHVYAASPGARGYTRAAEPHWIKVLSSGELAGCLVRNMIGGERLAECIFGPTVIVYPALTHSLVFQVRQVSCTIQLPH